LLQLCREKQLLRPMKPPATFIGLRLLLSANVAIAARELFR
jgi:hypothetical protein